MMATSRSEYDLQLAVCKYLKYKYPHILFRSDLAGIRMSKGLAVKCSRIQHSSGFPDLFIYYPNNGYCGLALELKTKPIYKKNGDLRKDEHLEKQARIHQYLRKKNYKAEFAVGIDEAMEKIDSYL